MQKEQLYIIGGILGSLALVIGGALIINQAKFGGDPSKLLTHGRAVHWHAQISASVCGEEQKMPVAEKGGTIGPHSGIHTHDDGLAHMEGIFNTKSDIAVRKYLLGVGIPFSEKGIFTKTEGSPCKPESTNSARLRGTVNDKPVDNILDYPMHDPANPADQQDKIRLVYE